MAAVGAIVICLGYFIPGADSIWWFIGAFIGLGLYLLFWWIQFYGVTQLEQGKLLFEKFSYEITSQQILMKTQSPRRHAFEVGSNKKRFYRQRPFCVVC